MMSEPALIILSPSKPAPDLRIYRKGISLRQYVDNKKAFFVVKRLLDVIISAIVIITILSWLLPVLALLIKYTSKGPVLFLQKRTGRGGRSFTCYKLRTMINNRYSKPVASYVEPTVALEDMVTPLGRFLRTSNLDELPQFFNVLMGSMSLVGPRPHMHADCNAFSLLIPGYKFRNLVKPGITGLAQVKGYHGKVTSRECIIKRYEWDAHYVRYAGFWLDVKIMFTTALRGIGIVIRYLALATFASPLRSLRYQERRF